ncbi:MAG: glycoside hydrolase family 3 C-terminal domain-containing protein, partial [Spirochaetales bacterium]|nr:glycoside hydrolase family 3 C-terminal domain-containing protein [Spirochaetales bacterium]
HSRGTTIFPHNIGLGAAGDPDLVREVGRITAKEQRGCGIEWAFGPCLTVPRDERWGRTYEGFGESPALQTLLAGAYIRGFQGTDMSGEGVVACAKHFAGDGGTTGGVDQGNTVCSETVLRQIHLQGYMEAIKAHVGTVMASFSSWNGDKCHGNSYLLTDVLKNELGFTGFIVSDWEGIGQVPGGIKQCINAGIDMAMEPYHWYDFINTLKSLVNTGEVPVSRIDDAVRRILRVKFTSGLFENPYAYVDPSVCGTTAHRDVAREAVRKSLVLLKNDGNLLPLSKNADIFVAGRNADNLGYQCGGWTITWQGSGGDITTGTTILDGIRNLIGSTHVTFSSNGTGAAGHDVAIVVIGETPYAEGEGDAVNLALSSTDLLCLNNVINTGIPVVVVLVSGRPMIITDQVDDWDACVAAWLPGTEGGGVAEVLFGDYDFSGKLPHTWPRTMSQIPINAGDPVYNPLFPYGFGLNYGSVPTPVPTGIPATPEPTPDPTPVPTVVPTQVPTAEPTIVATPDPTPDSTPVPTVLPTAVPGTLPWTETFDSEPGDRFSINQETRTWTSESIDISGAVSVFITADIEGDNAQVMESSDYINLYYSVDGGSQVAWSQDTDGFPLKTVSVTGLQGNTLQVHIRGYTSYSDETYYVDNIFVDEDQALTPDPTVAPTIVVTPDPTPVPTVEPTIVVTPDPTIVPTAEPTIVATPDPTPVPTSVPGTLPWTETFDSETGGRFSIRQQTRTWTSESIDISGVMSVSISADIEGVNAQVMEASDYLNLYYSIDGGSQVAWSQNTDGFTLKTVSITGLTGNSLRVHIEGATSYSDETYYVDNIIVGEGAVAPTSAPTSVPTTVPTSVPTAIPTPVPGGNLALNMDAYESSNEGAATVGGPEAAFDGDAGTRWSSEFDEPEWLYVDLGAVYSIGRVVLEWETAYGREYILQVSDDASTWIDLYHETSGDGGTDDITGLSGSGRYVRMYGISRGTQWGFSLWEFEVYSN